MFAAALSAALVPSSAKLPVHITPARARLLAVRCSEPPLSEPPAPPELTKVGSKAYYEGFLTQPVDATVTQERGDGTEQAVKFAASCFAVIAVHFLGFMASNGLL